MYERKNRDHQKQLKILSLEDLVPQDHILRVIDQSMDFSFIYDLVKDLYSQEDWGKPGIDPVSLFKIVFLQHLFGIRSMRQTIKEIEVNMAYRWFIGYDIGEDIPHFSTFSKNYSRRFKDTDVFEQIFMHILQEAIECGFVDASALFIDSTHVKANANKKKKLKKEVPVEAKRYKEQLECEIDQDRERHGKKPFKHDDDEGDGAETNSQETKTVTASTTDPECGVFRKGEHETCFAYTIHTGCDRHNFILGVEVSAGNVHDSVMFDPLYEQLDKQFPEAEAIVVDTGYKTPWIMKKIIDDGRAAVTGYKSPKTKKGFYRKYDYVYDEYNDWLICPAGEVLRYATTDREGYREYKSDARKCRGCKHLHECTESKKSQKVVRRHIWETYMEMAEEYRHTLKYKELYQERKETIERVFADAKERHGMRYTLKRSLARVKAEVTLIYACMNLKKLAKWKEKNKLLKGGKACLSVWLAKLQIKYMKRGNGARSISLFVYNLIGHEKDRSLSSGLFHVRDFSA